MKYYIVSDVHGFYTPMVKALEKAGFFEEKEPHKLVICGDLLDRGEEAQKTVDFVTKLLDEEKLVYVKGNHEDLFCDLLEYLENDDGEEYIDIPSHHIHNGTWDTFLQLSQLKNQEARLRPQRVVLRIKNNPFWKKLLPAAVDYFEIGKYVVTHGYIPYRYRFDDEDYITTWKFAPEEEWSTARWYNGMEVACMRMKTLPGKTVICGHWHTSFGHSKIEKKGSEFGTDADFSPFYGKGVIGIDACTAFSGKVNCLVIEE